MSKELKSELLNHLDELIFFSELSEANPFKIRAYKNAVEVLSQLQPDELLTKIKDGSLTEIKGIGKGLLSIAQAFAKTSSSAELKEAQGDFPRSLKDLNQINGLGPKKIRQLYEELEIKTLGELEYACKENRLVKAKGFGEKTQAKILHEIQSLKSRLGKSLLCDAYLATREFETEASESLPLNAVGDLGARREIVSGIRYLTSASLKKSAELLDDLKMVKTFKVHKGEDRIEIQLKNHVSLELMSSTLAPGEFISEVIRQTSSPAHWKALEAQAKKLKISLESLKASSEKDFYKVLGLAFHPAEAREFPPQADFQFLQSKDLQGVFHCHTLASDGLNSLDEMAAGALERGWSYLGLSDHSQTAFYAQGLKEESLESQWAEVDRLNTRLKGLRILKGVESDILKDGSLDYPKATLKKFDFVIASIHSRYGMTDMTARLIKAIENPATSMIGHISGRLLLARDAYDFDVAKVVDAAIKNKRIIELNSHPQRLDMDWRLLHSACEKGLVISINPDAHSVSGYDDVEFGVWMANKALVPREQILNTWSLPQVQKFLESQK